MTLPRIEIVVAMTRDRVIGTNNRLPWDLPEDRQLFRSLTLGSTVMMGANTYRSIGAPLSDRTNIVLSKKLRQRDGVLVCRSFLEGLATVRSSGQPVYVIGGEELYRKALTVADRLHISWVKGSFTGDRHFPEFDLADWQECETRLFVDFDYVRYCRKGAPGS